MRAMVLAAGLGTRLRPLTDTRPKALVEVAGRTLLEITLARLRTFGIREVIVNVHHFADMVVEYLKKNGNFGMGIEISREEVLLDTGGGLKKVAWFFLEKPDEPFILHNVDVISTIDFQRMLQVHHTTNALVTLAVQQRDTSRYLLFDPRQQLCGRLMANHQPEFARGAELARPLAFSGIHVISPRIFSRIREEGVFPIIPVYLRLAAEGENIFAFHADDYYWRDLGRPEHVTQASQDFETKVLLP